MIQIFKNPTYDFIGKRRWAYLDFEGGLAAVFFVTFVLFLFGGPALEDFARLCGRAPERRRDWPSWGTVRRRAPSLVPPPCIRNGRRVPGPRPERTADRRAQPPARSSEMSRATLVASSSPWPGIAGFVVATCILTWSSAIVADRVWDVVRESFPTRLLGASFYYFLTMAWPPVLAVVVVRRWIEPPGHLDLGLRRAGRGALLLGGLAAAAVAAAAMLIAWLVQRLDVVAAGTVTSPEPNLPYQFSLHTLVLLGVAFVGTTVLVSTQAFAEELGWRGYFLPRMMEGLGPWPGLLAHGFLWGVWYAPVVALPAHGSPAASARALSFVVTCTLLGTLLGCLRLRARSLSAAVLTNALLTVVAGLPFILRGVELGPRAAAYRPAGWIPLLLAAGILAAGLARRATAGPRRLAARSAEPARPSPLVTRNGRH